MKTKKTEFEEKAKEYRRIDAEYLDRQFRDILDAKDIKIKITTERGNTNYINISRESLYKIRCDLIRAALYHGHR